jgi:glutathione peroxidase
MEGHAMRKLITTIIIALGFSLANVAQAGSVPMFDFTSIEGTPLSLADYRGKAVLVVNTASRCGFTPQYTGLQSLWEKYRDRGLVVLGVPSNDFGAQEPGSESEIKSFCEVNFDIDFPMTAKEVVSGEAAHPFYKWAGEELGALSKPRWNFHKILLDTEGKTVDWFAPTTGPDADNLIAAIEAVLPG